MAYLKLSHPAQDGVYGLHGVKVPGLLSLFWGIQYLDMMERVWLRIVDSGEDSQTPRRQPFFVCVTVPMGTRDFRDIRTALFYELRRFGRQNSGASLACS